MELPFIKWRSLFFSSPISLSAPRTLWCCETASGPYMKITTGAGEQRFAVLFLALLAFFSVALNFLFQGNIGFNLADEGFLWYGAIQTSMGYVPLRDFQSYDPGRYYWATAWTPLFGNGIIGLRLALAVFQSVGLFCGILVLRKVMSGRWLLLFASFLLLAWMFPRHKLFEHSLTMGAVYVGVCLLESPSLGRYFLAGVFVGFAAFFGRNHGLYNGLAFLLLILLNQYKFTHHLLVKRLGLWLFGILVGYAPMLLMFAVIPGFFDAFLEGIYFLLRQGATNLFLPIPWPWVGENSTPDWFALAAHFFIGCEFLLILVFYAAAFLLVLLYRKGEAEQQAVLIASTCVGISYAHYAFSRADLSHLAQSIHPLLLGALALPSFLGVQRKEYWTKITLCFLLAFSVVPLYLGTPFFATCGLSGKNCVRSPVASDHLWVQNEQRLFLEKIETVVAQCVGPEEGLLLAPHWPGLYCILRRQSPVRQTYFLFPETTKNEQKMIGDLIAHNVRWVILADVALDGRDELRFRYTHKLMWQYLMREFEPVENGEIAPQYQLLRRRPSAKTASDQ